MLEQYIAVRSLHPLSSPDTDSYHAEVKSEAQKNSVANSAIMNASGGKDLGATTREAGSSDEWGTMVDVLSQWWLENDSGYSGDVEDEGGEFTGIEEEIYRQR